MYPPNLDPSLIASPLVEDLLQRAETSSPMTGPSVAAPSPLPNPGAPPASAQAGTSPDGGKLQQALSLIMPMLALGTALGGSARSGGALLRGYHTQQEIADQRQQRAAQIELQRQQEVRLQAEQSRIARAQEADRIDREQAREEQRQRAAMSMITDVTRQARTFTTKAEHDDFVNAADAMASQAYGTRPGAIRGAVPFVPTPVRDRAQKALDRIRKSAPDGQLALVGDAGHGVPDTAGKRVAYQPIEKSTISFDVDGDGKDELIPFRKLEELAGDAFYGADGQRLVPNQPARVATFGETFPQARGTVFADKPLPITARGQPDYGKALRDLHALNPGSTTTAAERRQARADAQQQARDRLYAAVLEGNDEKAMAGQFSGVFSGIGLSYRAELAKIRRDIFSAGSQGLSPEDRELSTTGDVMTRGREILGGASALSTPAAAPPVPAAAPARSGGRGGRPAASVSPTGGPVYTVRNDFLVLREKALEVLDAEAVRRGLPTGSVTEEQLKAFLKNPENVKRLQGRR